MPYTPRQEPGRYFLSMLVCAAVAPPHSQPFTPAPKLAVVAVAPPTVGISETTLPFTVVLMPVMVAVITPFASVPRAPTYFEVTPSQPQLFAPGGVPPV